MEGGYFIDASVTCKRSDLWQACLMGFVWVMVGVSAFDLMEST